MRIEQVDARDEAVFAEWFVVVDAVDRHTRPGERSGTEREQRATALDGRPAEDGTPPAVESQDLWLARDDDGRAVGAARLEQPLTDNTHVGFVLVHVLPEQRRRGVGGALLAIATAVTASAGRTLQMSELDEPPAVQGRSPGRAFLAASGFTEALVEVRRDLALPVDAGTLRGLEDDARAHATGYAVRTWQGRCPDDLVEDRAALGRAMSTDVPLQDLSWGEEAWDAERVRRREELVAAQGRTTLTAAAVHQATGTVVAFTEIAVVDGIPERAQQWETVVLSAHRGHRLGMLVKTALLRRLARTCPDVRTLSTCNADSNSHMIAVNEALGFRPNGTLTAWQRELGRGR
jgi:GNAT superfamily N-acetyltransferase